MAVPLGTPLAGAHERAGAKMGVWFGCALPDHYADWLAEYRAERESVALIDKSYRAYFSFTGPDRVRYLNAILTNNIKDLAAGAGTVSLLLNPQGHILAEMETYALGEKLFCVSYAMVRERLIETLDKYIIMDDVTLADETERWATVALEGPGAAEVVAEAADSIDSRESKVERKPGTKQISRGADLAAMSELEWVDAKVGGVGCRVIRRSARGAPGAEFLVEREKVAELWQFFTEKVRAAGGRAMGYTALSALRLEQGVPWFGYDFDERHIPHEARLQDSHISYTKGCYTGQEIVERVRSRGQVNRLRVSLKFAAAKPPVAGAPLLADGKEAGYVTRTAFSPALGSAIGMGYVRREYSAPGTRLTCDGAVAEVVELKLGI